MPPDVSRVETRRLGAWQLSHGPEGLCSHRRPAQGAAAPQGGSHSQLLLEPQETAAGDRDGTLAVLVGF